MLIMKKTAKLTLENNGLNHSEGGSVRFRFDDNSLFKSSIKETQVDSMSVCCARIWLNKRKISTATVKMS